MGKSIWQDKPFSISKHLVWEAYQKVKANRGAPGVDEESLADFEADLKNNLFKVWNRMSSGSCFPPLVLVVEIPKSGGGVRLLGVPAVGDRVAQMVAALALQPRTEVIFYPDSFGYRPRKSAHKALAACRERCWNKPWVIDLDIQRFFDSVPWDLMERAVAANITAEQSWVLLYVRRWLAAPLQQPDGTLVEWDRGAPQGSAISPVLANLFMHYAFDAWLECEFPAVAFERYADDAVIHCATGRQAHEVLAAVEARMERVGLRLHPGKTKIVYCKDGNRPGEHEHTSFTFLGYTFRPRTLQRHDGRRFVGFTPAVSPQALKEMSRQVRRWRVHRWVGLDLNALAEWINPIVAGWMNYYGRFTRSKLYPLLRRINSYLMRWARRKYKRLRAWNRAKAWWTEVTERDPGLFTHWTWTRGLPPK